MSPIYAAKRPHFDPPKFPIRCFYLEQTDRVVLALRRLQFSRDGQCFGAGGPGYHTASVMIEGEHPIKFGEGGRFLASHDDDFPDDDLRWPEKCEYCEHRFVGFPFWKTVDQDPIYRRKDTGEEMRLRDAPFGAMWYADWMNDHRHGPDGRYLVVQIPGLAADGKTWYGHDWGVDSRASNCSMPEDHEHRCWVREGVPPDVNVTKHGKTCAAGAGSIQVPGYHGYLRNGHLILA